MSQSPGSAKDENPRPQHSRRSLADDVYEENGILMSPQHIPLCLDDDYATGHYWVMKRRESGLFAGMNRVDALSKKLVDEVDRARAELEPPEPSCRPE